MNKLHSIWQGVRRVKIEEVDFNGVQSKNYCDPYLVFYMQDGAHVPDVKRC